MGGRAMRDVLSFLHNCGFLWLQLLVFIFILIFCIIINVILITITKSEGLRDKKTKKSIVITILGGIFFIVDYIISIWIV